MSRLCRLGLHAWRFTDWSEGDVDACGDACARPDCRRIRGSDDRLCVERVDSVVIPPEVMGAFFVPSPTRLVRERAPGTLSPEDKPSPKALRSRSPHVVAPIPPPAPPDSVRAAIPSSREQP